MASSLPHSGLRTASQYRWRQFLASFAVWHRLPHLTSSLSTKLTTQFYPLPGARLLPRIQRPDYLASRRVRHGFQAKGSAISSIDSSAVQLYRRSSTMAGSAQCEYSPRRQLMYRKCTCRWATSRSPSWAPPSISRKSLAMRLSTIKSSRPASARSYSASR